MKKLIVLALSILWAMGQAFAQNPYWAFPPKYVDFSSGGTVKTLGNGTITKSDASNAIFSLNGTLQLFGNGINYYNRTDGQLGMASLSYVSDVAFAPDPQYQNAYIVLGTGLVLDNLCGNCIPSKPVFFYRVKFNGTAGMCVDNLSDYLEFTHTPGIAIPASNNIASATPSPYLYIVHVDFVKGSIVSNITLSTYYGQSNAKYVTTSVLGNFFTYGAEAVPHKYNIKEATLSPDGTKLAYVIDNKNVIYYINNVNGCAGGNCGTNSVTSVTVSSATEINGVEFSPDGSKIFYTKSTSISGVNQISYYDIATGTHTDVANSQNLGNSQLKRAIDGYVYVSDGASLKGFNVASTPYTISKTIANVPNTAQTLGIYTLPDQINGLNYDNVEGCIAGPKTYTTSPLPSVKVAGTITASNTAGVASGQKAVWTSTSKITLQPNFRAVSGSVFKASIAPCAGSRALNNCTATVYARNEEVEESAGTEDALRVHPNPVSEGQLHFGRTVEHFTLMNTAGEILKRGSHTDRLEADDLQKGMYLLQLDDKIEKIIVQ